MNTNVIIYFLAQFIVYLSWQLIINDKCVQLKQKGFTSYYTLNKPKHYCIRLHHMMNILLLIHYETSKVYVCHNKRPKCYVDHTLIKSAVKYQIQNYIWKILILIKKIFKFSLQILMLNIAETYPLSVLHFLKGRF